MSAVTASTTEMFKPVALILVSGVASAMLKVMFWNQEYPNEFLQAYSVISWGGFVFGTLMASIFYAVEVHNNRKEETDQDVLKGMAATYIPLVFMVSVGFLIYELVTGATPSLQATAYTACSTFVLATLLLLSPLERFYLRVVEKLHQQS